MNRLAPKNCKECGVEFTPLSSRRIFCTEKCLKKKDDRLFYENHADRLKNRCKAYRDKHKELYVTYLKNWIAKNPERNREHKRKWNKLNRGYCTANTALYRLSKEQKTPPWLSEEQKQQIKQFYIEAAKLTRETGVLYSVDHIVPLKGKFVSGLHVPWNLQILPMIENSRKGNRYA